jgi:hypothetical protein
MDGFIRNLGIGFAAAALLIAGSGFEPTRAETTARAVQLAEGTASRPDYQSDMEQRIDAAAARMQDVETGTVEATDGQIAELEAAWDDVEAEWAEFQAAADENWEDAKVAMDAAWQNFQTAWDETFGNDGTVSQ